MSNGKIKRRIYAPSYYDEFKCTADSCRHSCCVDWEICIDSDTYEKYREIKSIISTVRESEDGPYFELCENGKCPHLNEDGLCDIILSYGEEYLSEICRNHPRFFNHVSAERTEAGLGIVCEEACRLILENDTPFQLTETDEFDEAESIGEATVYDPMPERDRIISMIESDGTFDEKIAEIKKEYGIPDLHTHEEWIDRFLSLEVLDPDWERDLRDIKGKHDHTDMKKSRIYDKYYCRLITYFVYRHVSVADSRENLCARLAFAVLSVRMIRLLFEEGVDSAVDTEHVPEMLIDWTRRYSAEIEYSEDNTDELIFMLESVI